MTADLGRQLFYDRVASIEDIAVGDFVGGEELVGSCGQLLGDGLDDVVDVVDDRLVACDDVAAGLKGQIAGDSTDDDPAGSLGAHDRPPRLVSSLTAVRADVSPTRVWAELCSHTVRFFRQTLPPCHIEP